MSDLVESLRRCVIFQDLSPDELRPLLPAVKRSAFRRGAYLWREEDRAEGLYVLLEGLVRVSRTSADGEETIFHLHFPGETFGEPGIYATEGDRRTDCRAIDPVRCLFIEGRAARSFIDRNPAVMRRLLQRVSDLARVLGQRVAAAAFFDARLRLVRLLLDLAGEQRGPIGAGARVGTRFSQKTLAGLLGVRRESVNRLLTRLEDEGLIARDVQGIVVRSPAALRAMLEPEATAPERAAGK